MTEKTQKELIREAAEADFVIFCKLINPHRLYGEVHEDVMRWLTRPDAKLNQLVLLPRAHMKSHVIAMWVAWWITKHPDATIIYVSATNDLAVLQLDAIKQVLECAQYRRYWPEMIHPEEGKRKKWSQTEITVDHPIRQQSMERDYTILSTSVKSNTTGLHCDILVFDDIVVPGNAYTQAGRAEVDLAYSMFSSVLNPGGVTKAVGTLYHPDDIYHKIREEEAEVFDEHGDIIEVEKLWETYEKEVESDQVFLWPREQHPITNEWFGFNPKILAGIRAKYKNKAHFYAQYYNQTNDPTALRVTRDKFQYYDARNVSYEGNYWTYNGRKLNVFAAMDVAWTTDSRSDYTAIAVIGMDSDGFIYVLDLDRFQTSDFLVYYEAILSMHAKWGFRRILIETNSGGKFVEQEVKKFIRQNGDALIVEGRNKTSKDETKAERIAQILEPRYNQREVWHCRGGYVTALEEEIVLERPKHDDLKDALCSAIEIAHAPAQRKAASHSVVSIKTHPRFGGVVRR